MERLGDQPLAYLRAIGVGGVDEVDAEFHRPAQEAAGFARVPGLAPNPAAGDPHRSKSEPVDLEVAPKQEAAAC